MELTAQLPRTAGGAGSAGDARAQSHVKVRAALAARRRDERLAPHSS